jgi:multidrug transporter EmrE-like cation transporter
MVKMKNQARFRSAAAPTEQEGFLTSAWLSLLMAIVGNSIGNLLLKVFSQKTDGDSIASFFSPWFIAGNLFFFVNLIFYGKALRGLAQHVAYPVMVGATVLFVMAASVLWFSERLSITSVIGAALIVSGIALLAHGS